MLRNKEVIEIEFLFIFVENKIKTVTHKLK